MRYMYTFDAPPPVRFELMGTPKFYVPAGRDAVKVAEFVRSSDVQTKCALFKLAADDGNLTSAYQKLQTINKASDDDMSEAEDSEAGDERIVSIGDESSAVEDDDPEDEFNDKGEE